MKRPLHLLIIGLGLTAFGGYSSLNLLKRQDLTRLGLILYMPLFITGCLLVLTYLIAPYLLRRFKAGELYARCFGVSLLVMLPLLFLGII